jgi:arylsulfatase A
MKIQWVKYLWFIFIVFGCNQNKKKNHSEKDNKRHPNIILILADDMGYGDPGSYNPSSMVPTPNIDRIAENGVLLTDAYAHPWCVPSRYGLMTGRHPVNSELNWRERSLINRDQITLASLLKRNDYYTAMIGKWHLGFDNFNWNGMVCDERLRGGPVDHGFDYFFGIHASLDLPPYFYIEGDVCLHRPTDHTGGNSSPGATRPVSGAFWREGHVSPDFKHAEVDPLFAEKAIQMIKSYHMSEKVQPFFLYLSLASPHTPWLPDTQFEGRSGAGEYGDFVMQVDNTVGRISSLLTELGLEDETLLIFTSDNGPLWFKDDIAKYDHRSAGTLRGMKQDVWEGGHRVPFVAQWPGKIPAKIIRDDIVSFDDMLATFAAIVGDRLPEYDELDSYNLLPVFLNEPLDAPVREELLIYNHAIRSGDWKFIRGSGEGRVSRVHVNDSLLTGQNIPGELYNLRDDISEQHNLFDKYPEIVHKLNTKLNDYITGIQE